MSRGEYDYELAALHLQMLVAMAAADNELRAVEVEELAHFVERVQLPEADRPRLEKLLRMLIDAPPELEPMLRQLMLYDEGPRVAELFVSDIARLAHADDYIDHREEALLRMVCGAFGLPPRSLHGHETRAASDAETEELRQLVHSLVMTPQG
jgi:tellurite resistance protein